MEVLYQCCCGLDVHKKALGASGRQMIQALIGGQQDSAVLAEMAKGLLRNKIPQLKLALEGRVNDHHRFLLNEMLDDLRHIESKMTTVGSGDRQAITPFRG
jgi:hypothetical protein